MTNELMDVSKQVEVWNQYKKIAQEMINSKLLPPTLNTPEKVITVIMTGRELQVPMMEAIRGINVIVGKPALSPQLMLAMINRSGQLEDMQIIPLPGKYCEVTMKRKGRAPYTAKFGEDEAKAMFLMGKDNYKKQPDNMFKWRAVSACARVVFPDVIGGLYTPEEVQSHAEVEDTMGQIEHQTGLLEEGKYDEFRDTFFNTLREALKSMKEPYDVEKFKKAYKSDLQTLTDVDRAEALAMLTSQHSSLIRGDEAPQDGIDDICPDCKQKGH